MHKRLAEKIDNFYKEELGANFNNDIIKKFADYLIDDGWIRPPCNIGQIFWVNTIYGTLRAMASDIQLTKNKTYIVHVVYDLIYCHKNNIDTQGRIGYLEDKFEFGETAFFTKEEAEAKLKEGAE